MLNARPAFRTEIGFAGSGDGLGRDGTGNGFRRFLCGFRPMPQFDLLLIYLFNGLGDGVRAGSTLHAVLSDRGRAPDSLELMHNAVYVNPGP